MRRFYNARLGAVVLHINLRYRLLLIVLESIYLVPMDRSAVCAEMPLPSKQVEDLRNSLKKAENSMQAREVWHAAINNLSNIDLRLLMYDVDSNIAIRACWETHRTLVWTRERPNREYNNASSQVGRLVLDVEDAQFFIGFIEGRLRLRVPQWWREDLRESKLSRQVFQYEGTDISPIDGGMILWHDKKISLQRKGENIEVRKHDGLIPVSFLELKRLSRQGILDHVAVTSDERDTYIAIHSTIGTCFPLLAIDNSTKTIRWRRDVWALGVNNLVAVSGIWYHNVESVSNEMIIAIFGSGTGGCYVEAFEIRTGRPVVRIATNNWLR